ncbi:MAG: LytTR family DNA-binding domain-containing protein [Arachidicoccus sp.]|nr:LytTR family DNA-binding domain-containing protein [Arachidicoccus sp.]
MNVLIVEDEAHTSDLLKEIIEEREEFGVVNTLDSVSDAVKYLSKFQQQIDLIFLDIQLSDGISFDIFKNVDIHIPIVFCTAYDQYTLQAIKNNGIDYILKPFDEKEVHKALEKYRRLAEVLGKKSNLPVTFQAPEPTSYQESFLVQLKEKTLVIETSQTAVFCVEHETVYLYTAKNERFPLFKNMDYIETSLPPNKFFRISRQMIINRENIISMEPFFNRKVILNLKISPKEKPIVSRLKVSLFKEWLERSGN